MNNKLVKSIFLIGLITFLFALESEAQNNPIKTPLSQEILDQLTNEISGQVIYNNLVSVAGAPWLREEKEFEDTFYESQRMYDLVLSYGIENVKLERAASDRTFDYATRGELWLTSPQKKLIARLDADAALIARGSQSVDFEAELIYIPPLNEEEAAVMLKPENRDKYKGKVALMWSHARGELGSVLDELGVRAVISFSSRDRYFDPNMVVYSSGSYGTGENLKAGFTISWKQWSELLEDLEYGEPVKMQCLTKMEKKQDKFEAVLSWIPGTEPNKAGVFFTAHLFEGYTKRGANDNAGGCLVQLEILRSLHRMIKDGEIEQPRRNIYFLWPNEISGTYRFISDNPGIISKSCININMDMVSEGLRKNNSWLTMSETPPHLASFYDGLANSVLNYVWRTNDIVYLNDSPRGRRGGQYFPKPMMEKNGSIDAFRYFMHEATGGSDHLCFNGSSVGVPGIEFFTWPDYWYHADTDTPDKGDPTQMKRIAFIGAATAYATANCSDESLSGLIDVTSAYGYKRFAERGIAKATELINNSDKESVEANANKAATIIGVSAEREIQALESIADIYSGSEKAVKELKRSVDSWQEYKLMMTDHIQELSSQKSVSLGVKLKGIKGSSLDKQLDLIVPQISPELKYKTFSTGNYPKYQEYLGKNPDTPAARFGRSRDSRTIVNYINGKSSATDIISYAEVYRAKNFDKQTVLAYLEMLKEIGYIVY